MLDVLKERVFLANMALPKHKLVTFTWGNVSAIDHEQQLMVIKPSGIAYDDMTPADMVIVNMQGDVVEGKYRPSSDTPTHLALYQHYPEIGGIVHTHSTYATAWAQTGCAIPPLGTTHADYFFGDILCTRPLTINEVDNDYEHHTGSVIIETLAQHHPMYTPSILVYQHGPFSWGKTPEEAVHNAVVLEEIAKMAFLSGAIKHDINRLDNHLMDKHFSRKHGPHAYYGQIKPEK